MANKKTAQQKAREAASQHAQATLNHVRLTPRKLRLAVDLIRGKQVEPALQILQFNKRRASDVIRKLLLSAIANAKEHKGLDIDKLWVRAGYVNQGPTLKRFMPRAKGSASEIKKRSSHVTIVVGD